jgi:hypothetical protein
MHGTYPVFPTVTGLDRAHSVNAGTGNNAVYVGFGYTF